MYRNPKQIRYKRLDEMLRTWYLRNHFFTRLLSESNIIDVGDAIPTAGVALLHGRIQFAYNPKFFDKLTDIKMETVVLHECMHLVFRHPALIKNKDREIANIVMDMIVNEHIYKFRSSNELLIPNAAKPLQLPNIINENGKPTKYEGVNREYVIVEVCKRGEYLQKDMDYLDDADFDKAYEYVLKYFPKQGGKGQGQESQGQPQQGQGQFKSCAGMNASKMSQPANGTGVHIESDANEKDIGRKIQEIAKACKARGSLPGTLEGILNKIGKPRYTGWIKALKAAVGYNRFKGFEQTYRRYNRRAGHITSAILKASTKIFTDSLVVGVDTSGSMSDSDIEEVFGVIDYMSKFYNITVIQCDAAISEDSIFEYKKRGDWRKIKITGRGGTCFHPVFDYMNEKGWNKKTLIYLTDGYASFDFDNHGIDTVWVYTAGAEERFDPPFGKIVRKVMG